MTNIKWEYWTVSQSKQMSVEELNHYGSQGWELINMFISHNTLHYYIFKRPIE